MGIGKQLREIRLRSVRHFVADDGRILCRKCRLRLKAAGKMKQSDDEYR